MGVGMDVDLGAYSRSAEKKKVGEKQAKGSICVSAPPEQGQYGPLRERHCDEDLDGRANSSHYPLVPHFKHILNRQAGAIALCETGHILKKGAATLVCSRSGNVGV